MSSKLFWLNSHIISLLSLEVIMHLAPCVCVCIWPNLCCTHLWLYVHESVKVWRVIRNICVEIFHRLSSLLLNSQQGLQALNGGSPPDEAGGDLLSALSKFYSPNVSLNYSKMDIDSHFALASRIIGSKRFLPLRRSRKCQSALAYSFIGRYSCPRLLPPRPAPSVHPDTTLKEG